MKKYILTSTIYHTGKDIAFYGIALIKTDGMTHELVTAFNDLTENKDKVQNLVDLCNENNLSCVHFKNAIQDLLAE